VKIDIYSHILPKNYLAAFSKKNIDVSHSIEASVPGLIDIDFRLRVMDRYPDVLQVLTVSLPAVESFVSPSDAIELARLANDELAELVTKYPGKFIAAVASLPLNDIDASLLEIDRAINQLGLKGIQLFGRSKGDQLSDPKFKPLFQKMASYNLPIWIHPCSDGQPMEPMLNWPYITGTTMSQIVSAGIFNDYPDIKIITHHCGGVVPFLGGRIKWMFPGAFKADDPARKWSEHFHKFYCDTATLGYTPALMCGYDYFGADHMLLGTDAPLPSHGFTFEIIDSIQQMNISEADKEKIYFRNALRLLNIII